jgi:cell division protein FtsB
MMQQRKSQKRSKNPRFFSRHLIFAGSIIHHPSSNANELKKRRSLKLKLTSFVCVHKKTKWRQDESIATTTATTSEKQKSSLAPDIYVSTYVPTYTMYQYELPVSIFNSDLHLDHLYSSVTTHS